MSSLTEQIVDRLRTKIISGAVEPGDRLTEASLSHQFEVSRVPVREALRTLQSEGFVVLRPYAGAVVASLDADDVSDLFAVRQVIETRTFRRCAERFAALAAAECRRPSGPSAVREASRRGWDAESADLARVAAELDEILTAADQVVGQGETAGLPALNTRFHLAVAHACQNISLALLLRQVAAKIEWVYSRDVDTRAASSWAEHRTLAEAVRAGDVERVDVLITEHVGKARIAHFTTS